MAPPPQSSKPKVPRTNSGAAAAGGAAAGASAVGGAAAGRPRTPPVTRSGRAVAVPELTLLDGTDPIFILSANRRGGSGKSTNTAALGMSLAYRGYNVLIVRPFTAG